jgi:hypothetical protein
MRRTSDAPDLGAIAVLIAPPAAGPAKPRPAPRIGRFSSHHAAIIGVSIPVVAKSKSSTSRYSHLFAWISEEDEGFAVQVRLHDEAKPQASAWGEEIADSLEAASIMVAKLASEFSIPQGRIKIEIRMTDMTNGTQH